MISINFGIDGLIWIPPLIIYCNQFNFFRTNFSFGFFANQIFCLERFHFQPPLLSLSIRYDHHSTNQLTKKKKNSIKFNIKKNLFFVFIISFCESWVLIFKTFILIFHFYKLSDFMFNKFNFIYL